MVTNKSKLRTFKLQCHQQRLARTLTPKGGPVQFNLKLRKKILRCVFEDSMAGRNRNDRGKPNSGNQIIFGKPKRVN